MMTTSVETPGAAARICMRGEYGGALAATQRERERGQGREGAHLALGICSFNSGGLVCGYQPRVVPVSKGRDSSAQNTRRHSRRWLGTKVT